MEKLVLALALLSSGCRGYLSPYGPASICPADARLLNASAAAVQYWKNAGLTQLELCGEGSIPVMIDDAPGYPGQYQHTSPDGPRIYISSTTATWAQSENPDHLSWAQGLIAHELGHALGLQHAPTNEQSIMTPLVSDLPFFPYRFDVYSARSLYQ